MLSYNRRQLEFCLRAGKNISLVPADQTFKFSGYTTYGLGGGARRAYFPRNLIEARAVFECARSQGDKIFILGGGSDVLASDGGFKGTVICTQKLSGVLRLGSGKIFCLAGTKISRLLSYCQKHCLGGLEYLAGIPATIGGVVCMNGGAGDKYISSNVHSVLIFNGVDVVLSAKDCNFTYKHSTMRDIDCIVLGVILKVEPSEESVIRSRIAERLANRCALPMGRSCGCVFKNVRLVDGRFISAGKIVQDCGLAGFGDARVFVSPEHCNFIINNGGSAREVACLIDKVRSIVMQKTGIELEEEVVRVGEF